MSEDEVDFVSKLEDSPTWVVWMILALAIFVIIAKLLQKGQTLL